MKTSRKEILTNLYLEFQRDINTINNKYKNLFPSLDELDIIDLLFLFNFTFKQNEDYHEPIKTLMKSNNINLIESEYKEVFPIVKNFIDNLFEFQKK